MSEECQNLKKIVFLAAGEDKGSGGGEEVQFCDVCQTHSGYN